MSSGARLVAFPSVTHSLATLPNATSVSGVSIHYPLTPSGYSQQSEDKVCLTSYLIRQLQSKLTFPLPLPQLRRAIASNMNGRISSASSVVSLI